PATPAGGTQCSHPPFRSARHLSAAIRRGDVSSRELLDLYLSRIERLNPSLNAVVTLDVEGARRAAEAADAALARGQVLGPLHGVPLTIKHSHEPPTRPTPTHPPPST